MSDLKCLHLVVIVEQTVALTMSITFSSGVHACAEYTCAQAAVLAQVEVSRSSSTGMMGVRRKNVMRKVAS